MKKNRVLCLLLAVLMALSMAGCKGNSPGSETLHTGSSKKKPSKADIDSTSIRNPNTDRLNGSGGDGVNIEGDYDDSLDLAPGDDGHRTLHFVRGGVHRQLGGRTRRSGHPPVGMGSLRRILACAPNIRSFARSPVSGWWAAAAAARVVPRDPTPPLR